MSTLNDVSIRIMQAMEQNVHPDIRRVIGLLPARFIATLIDELDLEANPRNSRLGSVTEAIIQSIQQDEQTAEEKLFPFKSKGLLLASSRYKELERNRYTLSFIDLHTEGILDGGHNTLAIGVYILTQAERVAGKKPPKKKDVCIWEEFKRTWVALREDVTSYLALLRDETTREQLKQEGIGTLEFSVPIELLLPKDQDDELCLESFRTSLLEICDARNNNAQLTQGTKANQEGLFDSFANRFKLKDPDFANEISWKTNDGKRVDSRTLIALSWIPLSLTHWITGNDTPLDAPAPTALYNSKEKCLERFIDLMRDEHITISPKSARRELKDEAVGSALNVATDLPWLFDKLYLLFPSCYNTIGNYGRIGAVKSLMNKRDDYKTPFLGERAERPVPDGYLYPIVFGLRALMRENPITRKIEWTTDPYAFVESEYCKEAIIQYCGVIQQSDYDPQKVGKGIFSYTSAENAFKLALMQYRSNL